MGKKVLINFATPCFYKSQKKNSETGKAIGKLDYAISYKPKNIDKEFCFNNYDILSQKRGAGYWLWKPYFIKKTFDILDYGDYVFYCDSGSEFIESTKSLFDIFYDKKTDIVLFDVAAGYPEKYYSKRDAFILIGADNDKVSESHQRAGTYSIWKKTDFSCEFVDEFLKYSCDKRVITDIDNELGFQNYLGFVDHRHDQSVLSILSKKYNIESYRDPSQYGNCVIEKYRNSNYPQILNLTRQRNISIFSKLKSRIFNLYHYCPIK